MYFFYNLEADIGPISWYLLSVCWGYSLNKEKIVLHKPH